MKSEKEIQQEIKRRIKLLSMKSEKENILIHCCWINCLDWVLNEEINNGKRFTR